MNDLRRGVTRLVILCFSVAALMGIVALLSGGDFGETEARVLLTTVIVGVESLAMLGYLTLLGHRLQGVAYLGVPMSLVATALALFLTWSEAEGDTTWKAFGVALTLAASLAQTSLLLAVAGKQRVGPGLSATLVTVAVLAGLVLYAILSDGDVGGDGYWRILGVTAILDVLGTVVLTATASREDVGPPETALVTSQTEQRLTAAARERGTTPDQLVNDALDAYLS
jgi:hypothetical protein